MHTDKHALEALRIDRSAVPRRRFPLPLFLAVLVLGAVGSGGVWWYNQPKQATVRTVVVEVSPSNTRDRTLLNASGYVTARREATVSSKVTGKVMEVLVEEGMSVEAGQILARLDASNVENNLRLAEAQAESTRRALNETRANIELAEREYRRVSQLARSGIATLSESDRADVELKALRARLERQTADIAVAEREVALWQQQLDDTIIRAPFSGVLTSKDAQPGEMVSPISAGGGFTRTGICTIVDMSSLEIEVDVSESYINRVQPEMPVIATLDSYPDWKIPARVIAIIPTADRQKATVKVRVGFETLDPRILPDMSVKVAFQSTEETTEPERRVTLPSTAIFQGDGKDIVWVVKDGRVERRAITVGTVNDGMATIVAGVSQGDRVVTEGADNLHDGARVTEAER